MTSMLLLLLSCPTEAAAAVAQAHRMEREMATMPVQHQAGPAAVIPARAPEQLTAAVAQAAMEALAAEMQAAEAIEAAGHAEPRAVTATAVMANLPAAAFQGPRFGISGLRERERSPIQSHRAPNNSEDAGVPIPGLRVRTRAVRSSHLLQQDAACNTAAGECKSAREVPTAVRALRMSSFG